MNTHAGVGTDKEERKRQSCPLQPPSDKERAERLVVTLPRLLCLRVVLFICASLWVCDQMLVL